MGGGGGSEKTVNETEWRRRVVDLNSKLFIFFILGLGFGIQSEVWFEIRLFGFILVSRKLFASILTKLLNHLGQSHTIR